MKNRSVCTLLGLLLCASACDDAGAEGVEQLIAESPEPAVTPVGSLYASTTASPEALWSEFQSIHELATATTAITAGRRLDALLTEEARAIYANAMTDSMRAIRPVPATASFALDEMRYRLLGDSAVVRQARIKRYKLGRVRPAGVNRATLDIHDGTALVMQLPAAREHGAWRFLPSSDLTATYEELYPLPDSDPALPRRFATPQQAADALVAALNVGNAWDVFTMLDSTTKARIKEILPRIGATEETFVRGLEREIRSFRNAQGRANIRSITLTAPDRARFVLRYERGHTESATAVREDGTWRIQMRI